MALDLENIKKHLLEWLNFSVHHFRRGYYEEDYGIRWKDFSSNYGSFVVNIVFFVEYHIKNWSIDHCTTIDQIRDIVLQLLETPIEEISIYLKSKWEKDDIIVLLQEAKKDLEKWIVQQVHAWKWVQIYPQWTELTKEIIVKEMLKDMTYSITHNAKNKKSETLYDLGMNLAQRIWYKEDHLD